MILDIFFGDTQQNTGTVPPQGHTVCRSATAVVVNKKYKMYVNLEQEI